MAGLVLLVALGGLAMAFMRTGLGEAQRQSAREQGLRVFYIAEAGIQSAILDLKSGGSGNLGSRTSPIRFGGGTCWVTSVDNGDESFTITSFGILGFQRRAIQVVLVPEYKSLFAKALFGDLDLRGTGAVFADSYDTAFGTYASQAVNYDPVTGSTYARKKGHLGSNGDIQIDGTVTVFGDATPGPDHAVLLSGGPAYISGSTAPSPTVNPLVAVKYDPPVPALGPFSKATSVVLNAGVYHFRSFKATADAVITFRGDVTLYVDGDLELAGQAQLVVESGARVIVHTRGTNVKISGGGLVNVDGLPASFRVYTSATYVTFTGASGFHGAIYAPNALVTPSGTTDIYGSFVGRHIKVAGGARFHYDEMLAKTIDSIKVLKAGAVRRTPFPEY